MADIKFYCAKCQSKLAIDSSAIGYTIDCPDCGETLTVPAHSQPPPGEPPTKSVPPAETQKIAPMPPSPASADPGLKERIKTLEEDRKRFEEALRLEQVRTSGFTRLEAKIADLLQQLETARAAQEAAEKNAKRLIKDKHALSEKLQKAESELKKGSAAASELKAELEQLRAERERATGVDEQRTAELKELRQRVAEQAEAVTRLDELEKEKAAVEKDKALAEAQWQDARAEVERLTEAQATAAKEVARLSEAQSAGAEEREELSRERTRAEAAEARVRELEDQLAAAGQEDATQAERAKTLQMRLDAALLKMEALEQEKSKLAQAVTFATEEAGRIQAQLGDTEEQAREVARLRTRIKELESTPQPEKDSGATAPAVVREDPVRPRPVTVRQPSLYKRPALPGKAGSKSRKLIFLAVGLGLLTAVGAAGWFFRDAIIAAFGGGPPPAPPLHASALTTRPPKPTEPISAEGQAIVDDVEITIHQASIDHVTRVDPLGNELRSERPYLILDVALRNLSDRESIFMLHAWEQSTLTDDLKQSRRPAFPSRFSVDHVVGTLGATEIKPGQTVEDRLVFEVPSEEARSFTLTSDPGFWKRAEEGRYTAASRSSFALTFTRNQIVAP